MWNSELISFGAYRSGFNVCVVPILGAWCALIFLEAFGFVVNVDRVSTIVVFCHGVAIGFCHVFATWFLHRFSTEENGWFLILELCVLNSIV